MTFTPFVEPIVSWLEDARGLGGAPVVTLDPKPRSAAGNRPGLRSLRVGSAGLATCRFFDLMEVLPVELRFHVCVLAHGGSAEEADCVPSPLQLHRTSVDRLVLVPQRRRRTFARVASKVVAVAVVTNLANMGVVDGDHRDEVVATLLVVRVGTLHVFLAAMFVPFGVALCCSVSRIKAKDIG